MECRDVLLDAIRPGVSSRSVYDTGHGFGLQLKDMVEVTAQGERLLSDVNHNRDLIAVG